MSLPLHKDKVVPGVESSAVIARIMTPDEIRLCCHWHDADDPSQIGCGSLKIVNAYQARFVDLAIAPGGGTMHLVGRLESVNQIVTKVTYIAAVDAA